jgi:hypothetical protein
MELLMSLAESPVFVEYVKRATTDARTEERRFSVESILVERFGSLDEELSTIVPKVVQLLPSEFTPLLMHWSREELVERFGEA